MAIHWYTPESCNGYPYPWVNGWVMGMGLDAWVGTRDPGFTTTELADYRATRRIVVRVNGWVIGE